MPILRPIAQKRLLKFALLGFLAVAPAFAATTLRLDSSAGDPIGGGVLRNFDDGNATFTASCGPGVVKLIAQTAPYTYWRLDYVSPSGTPLNVDVYEDAQHYPFNFPLQPGLAISSTNSCSNSFGRFVVRELLCSPQGVVQQLAIDAEQRCNSSTAPALTANLRINSTVPPVVPQPTASAGRDRTVTEGETVQLDGTRSYAPGGIASVGWSQISGPTATLTNADTLTPTFVAPPVTPGGANMVLQLTVTGSSGLSDSNQIGLRVRDAGDPRTLLTVVSSPGEPVGGGSTTRLTPDDALFQSGCSSTAMYLNLSGIGNWYLNLSAPGGLPLLPDVYESARRNAQTPFVPQLSIDGNGRSCYDAFGRFVVREFVCATNGTIDRLAIDAEQRCNGADNPPLQAYIRINSAIPEIVPQPTAAAGLDQWVTEGDPVTLDGSRSVAPGGIAAVNWQVVSGPGVVFSDTTILKPTFTAPTVPPGGATVELQLSITGMNGLIDSNRVKVHVRDADDPRTFLSVVSAQGDYIGKGLTERFTDADTTFTTVCRDELVGISLDGHARYSITASSPVGQILMPDVYEEARRVWSVTPIHPGLSISANGSGCNDAFGRFVVREIACSPTGVIQRLAIDAEHHCDQPNNPPLFAYLRINSTIPEIVPQPTAAAGPDQFVTEQELVTLDGSRSFAPEGIASFNWQVISGQAITLSDPTAIKPTFVAPAVAPAGEAIVLELRVVDNSGRVDRNRVTINVRFSNTPRTQMVVVSHPGDWVGSGITQTLNSYDHIIETSCSSSQLHVRMQGTELWNVYLAAASGFSLTTGTYENATRWPFQNPANPGLDVTGEGNGCNTSSGRFVISEIACGPDGHLQKLAVDIEQHCGAPTAPPLFAFLRVNSTVATPDQFDRGCRLDVDGNGSLSSIHDGAGLLRGLAGMLGSALEGTLPGVSGATRYSYFQLEPYFRNTCAVLPRSVGPPVCSLDLDGDGKIQLTTDGVIATRLIAGLRGDTVLAKSTGAGATRTSWAQLAPYLAACKLLPAP